jgi:hypothetical protein
MPGVSIKLLKISIKSLIVIAGEHSLMEVIIYNSWFSLHLILGGDRGHQSLDLYMPTRSHSADLSINLW